MEVIITHEQADFDALASQLAAFLIDPSRKPVLPNKINRNVKKYLNLYGSELPFITINDLPGTQIDGVTLVDTQSLVTMKGVSAKTDIHVVDHHLLRTDIPQDWHTTIETVGATTTILIDQLRKRDLQFSVIESTLLLLGIYEDTGSLSYASTTVRDVQACAFLLEKGADLKIAYGYLNPALSIEQRKLADDLSENAVFLKILGKSVIVSCADAGEMKEEISSIAHKLRDLLDPDALFLFVKTSEGYRMIARSTTDDINVGKVAEQFGGGGHERAAAALIHPASENGDWKQITSHLVGDLQHILEKTIIPSITVNRIMSKNPKLISRRTTVSEAATLMQKYGYEGFPVVEGEEVLGLLTRRAIDRAIAHKLTRTAESLMEAGNFSLIPTQTLEDVQDLMASTGWGQLLVKDPLSNKIVGIVTRTDLLKNLMNPGKKASDKKLYGPVIEDNIPPIRFKLLKNIITCAEEKHMPIYIVGGFVRDLILIRPTNDFDIVVEGDALILAQMLSSKFGGRVISHKNFGTAKWQIKEIQSQLCDKLGFTIDLAQELPPTIDLVSARTEFYDHPTALPTVEHSDISQDLHRRDFTINTLAIRLDASHYGELVDHWGGLEDIRTKQIKVLHSLSFVDDPTRLLRAVRFEQRFNFTIEKRTLHLMIEACNLLKQVSGDRLRHELELIFNEVNFDSILTRLDSLNLLSEIHPELRRDEAIKGSMLKISRLNVDPAWALPKQVGSYPLKVAVKYISWLMWLGEKPALNVANRFRISDGLLKTIVLSAKFWSERNAFNSLSPSEFCNAVQNVPLTGLWVISQISEDPELKARLHAFVTKWRMIKPFINGEQLLKMGIPPSPKYARILTRIRDAWIDGVINNKDEEERFLNQLIN